MEGISSVARWLEVGQVARGGICAAQAHTSVVERRRWEAEDGEWKAYKRAGIQSSYKHGHAHGHGLSLVQYRIVMSCIRLAHSRLISELAASQTERVAQTAGVRLMYGPSS